MAQARRGQGTVTETLQLCNASTSEPAQVQTINLRLAPRLKKKVTWQADTVDNEHMQKKKSKKCCIFEKAGGSDEDEDEDGDEDDDDGGKGKGKEHHHHRDCNHGDHDDPNHGATSSGSQSLD